MKRDPYSGHQLTFARTDPTGRWVRLECHTAPTAHTILLYGAGLALALATPALLVYLSV